MSNLMEMQASSSSIALVVEVTDIDFKKSSRVNEWIILYCVSLYKLFSSQ